MKVDITINGLPQLLRELLRWPSPDPDGSR
jgi:hypothetical protein